MCWNCRNISPYWILVIGIKCIECQLLYIWSRVDWCLLHSSSYQESRGATLKYPVVMSLDEFNQLITHTVALFLLAMWNPSNTIASCCKNWLDTLRLFPTDVGIAVLISRENLQQTSLWGKYVVSSIVVAQTPGTHNHHSFKEPNYFHLFEAHSLKRWLPCFNVFQLLYTLPYFLAVSGCKKSRKSQKKSSQVTHRHQAPWKANWLSNLHRSKRYRKRHRQTLVQNFGTSHQQKRRGESSKKLLWNMVAFYLSTSVLQVFPSALISSLSFCSADISRFSAAMSSFAAS